MERMLFKMSLKNKKDQFRSFRMFLMRDNVAGMAIGLVVGTAFTSVIKSIMSDLINPILSVIWGKIDLSTRHFDIKNIETNKVLFTFNYGNLILTIIEFFIVAFVVFLVIRAMNKWLAKADDEELGYSEQTNQLKKLNLNIKELTAINQKLYDQQSKGYIIEHRDGTTDIYRQNTKNFRK